MVVLGQKRQFVECVCASGAPINASPPPQSGQRRQPQKNSPPESTDKERVIVWVARRYWNDTGIEILSVVVDQGHYIKVPNCTNKSIRGATWLRGSDIDVLFFYIPCEQ